MRGYDFIMIGFILLGILMGFMMGSLMWEGGILLIGLACILYGLGRDNYQATRRMK